MLSQNIKKSILEIKREIVDKYIKESCGYFRPDGTHWITVNDSDVNYCSVNVYKDHLKHGKKYIFPVIWHTHPYHEKFYPSYQDILQIFKNADLNQSYVITSLGVWIMSYRGSKIISEDEKAEELLLWSDLYIYRNTAKGRSINIEAIARFKRNLEKIPNFHIDFFDYQQLEKLEFSFES